MVSDSLNELLTAMTSDDPQMRETAVRTLGTLVLARDNTPEDGLIGTMPNANSRWTNVLSAIAGALEDQDWGVRQSAAEMVIKLDLPSHEHAHALLMHDLVDDDPEIRLGAGWSLALLNDANAVDPLIALLNQTDPILVASAADALGETNDPRAVSALAPLLDNADQDIRDAAEDALDRLTRRED